eukprot:8804602-Pyramimonas_sp.AAC.1
MFRFRNNFGGCLRRFAGFSTLRGAAGKYFTRPLSRDVRGDISGGLAFFSSNMFRFRSRFGGRSRP